MSGFAAVSEPKKLTTQQKLLVDYMERGRTLTNKVALTCLGVGSLSSRISELRRLGYKITTGQEEDTLTGRWFKKYNLKAEGDPNVSP